MTIVLEETRCCSKGVQHFRQKKTMSEKEKVSCEHNKLNLSPITFNKSIFAKMKVFLLSISPIEEPRRVA